MRVPADGCRVRAALQHMGESVVDAGRSPAAASGAARVPDRLCQSARALALPGGRGSMVELVIADDHRVFAEALRSVLPERGFEVAGVAADAAEAVRLAQRCQPDICLLDRCLVADSETIGDIRRAARRSRVVVLSPDTDTRSMRAVLARGAHGYVSKMCGLEVLLTALSGVMDGEVVVELADNGSPPSERGDDVLRLAEQLTA